ncbi:hypothetical protein CYMTET_15460 [Cymbomonas tetramitiformis]|uniref:Methyltransferase domain-containing protein n=1 Tax=Cymbomonas tetramitiformis TaxID=36881 RepID=A0AAE0GE58_9CHLO|nr:hypothetical protein CYMTET_15460 [Cymbomonas tetramitiformis]
MIASHVKPEVRETKKCAYLQVRRNGKGDSSRNFHDMDRRMPFRGVLPALRPRWFSISSGRFQKTAPRCATPCASIDTVVPRAKQARGARFYPIILKLSLGTPWSSARYRRGRAACTQRPSSKSRRHEHEVALSDPWILSSDLQDWPGVAALPERPAAVPQRVWTARLAALLECVPCDTRRMADIGCDHGILSLAAAASGRAQDVIAVDASSSAAMGAHRRLAALHSLDLRRRVELRIGDGATVVMPSDEVDVVVLAGLGTDTMDKVLGELRQRGALDHLVRAILSPPLPHAAAARACAAQHGLFVTHESVLIERGIIHVALCCDSVDSSGVDGANCEAEHLLDVQLGRLLRHSSIAATNPLIPAVVRARAAHAIAGGANEDGALLLAEALRLEAVFDGGNGARWMAAPAPKVRPARSPHLAAGDEGP